MLLVLLLMTNFGFEKLILANIYVHTLNLEINAIAFLLLLNLN